MSLSCLSIVKRGNDKKRPSPASLYVVGTSCTDRSASMNSMGRAVEDGMEAFLKTQKECAINEKRQGKTFWRHVTFDTYKDIVYKGEGDKTHNLLMEANINNKDLIPRNMTRLFDTAIEEIEILRETRSKLKKSLSKEEKNLGVEVMAFFTLLTDGWDNQSIPGSEIKMRDAIEKSRKEGIVCSFLGANQDAELVGPKYGFSVGNSLTFATNAPIGENSNDTGIYNALSSASSNVARACSGGGGDCIPFSPLQRSSSQPRDYISPEKKPLKYSQQGKLGYDSDSDSDISIGDMNLPIPKLTRC